MTHVWMYLRFSELTNAIETNFKELSKEKILNSKIRSELEEVDQPIAPLDTLIASHAMSLKTTLMTDHKKEFSRVKGSRVDNWVAG